MTDSMSRTVMVSLLLHLAAVICFVNFAGREREKPVVIDLSLFEPAGGAPEGGSKTTAKRGVGASPAAAPSSRNAMAAPTPLLAPAQPARQVTPPAPAATAVKAAQVPPPAPVRPAPTAPVPHPQAQAKPVREKELAARQGAANTAAGAAASTTGGASSKGGAAGNQGGAAGKGEGAHVSAGNGDPRGSGVGSGSEQLQKKYVAENFTYIMRIIQSRMVYPEKARREGLTGKARVSFVVLENGEVTDIKFLSRTGYEILDANLVKTIRKAAPFPRPPIKAELQMMLSYRLDQ